MINPFILRRPVPTPESDTEVLFYDAAQTPSSSATLPAPPGETIYGRYRSHLANSRFQIVVFMGERVDGVLQCCGGDLWWWAVAVEVDEIGSQLVELVFQRRDICQRVSL